MAEKVRKNPNSKNSNAHIHGRQNNHVKFYYFPQGGAMTARLIMALENKVLDRMI